MKYSVILITLSLLFLSAGVDTNEDNKPPFAFIHVNIIPMDKEHILEDYTVITANGIITEMGPSSSIKIPEGAITLDVTGKFMIPGLSDMHVHLEGDAWNIMYPPGARYTEEELNFEDIFFLYIAHGITLIDVMSAFPEHIKLREQISRNEFMGPRLLLSRMIDGAGKAWPPPISTWVNNPAEAKAAVIDAHEQGYDRIKVYSFLDKPCYDTIIAVANKLNMPVDGHIPISTSVEYVVESGQDMIAHIEEVMKFAKDFSPEQIDYQATLIAESNTWLTSTLIHSHNLVELLKNDKQAFSKSGIEYLHPLGLGIWTYINENLYQPIPEAGRSGIESGYESFQVPFTIEFYKKGGKLLAGTDALIPSNLPGFSLHKELEELVNAGLSPYEALRVSTTNSYEFLGELQNAGTIAIGKQANLVLLDENPLKNISNTRTIYGVVVQKQFIQRSEIDERLMKIRESYKQLQLSKSN